MVMPHMLFNMQDIGLLMLNSTIQFSNRVQAACLPDSKPNNDMNCATTGWGTTTQGM